MALAIDASTPAVVTQANGAVATVTTASFTPPAGALLLVRWSGNTKVTAPGAPSITDSLGVPLTYTLIDWQSRADSPTVNGQAASWWAVVGSSAAMTVTVTSGSASPSLQAALHVTVITGQHATPIGAHGKTGSASTAAIAQNYTATATGGQGFIVVCDWDAKGSMTAGTGCTLTDGGTGTIPTTQISYGFLRRTSADDTNGNSNTLNVTLAGTSTNANWSYVEVVPAAAAADIPWNPQRTVQTRDPGETWWIQRDRRDANLVATAANDLDEPLLQRTAQDEVYGLAAYRDRRLVPQQPNRVGDMSLFASAANDLPQPLFQPADALYWHLYNDVPIRTWRPQQRTYYDPSLLAQATAAVTYTAPRTVPSRDPGEVPWLQRPGRDPSLLSTALLENELLGGATTAQRANTPASNGPRWWMPQQPQREAYSPGLLDTALLEGPLVWIRPQQFMADRREVPQQRAYISDPSFYPVAGVTDPLTLAWGAGGNYWHLYNDTAVRDRRWWPQQRQLESDPNLLLTALLESPLNVGSYRWIVVDRRRQPQQLRWTDPSLLDTPADPLLLLDDRTRRTNTPATHRDRRQTVRERPRWTVFVSLDEAVGINVPFTSTNDGAVIAGATDGGRISSTGRGAVIVLTDDGPLFISQTKGGVL